MDAQQLGGLVALHQEIVDRVLKGKLDPVFVIRQIRKNILTYRDDKAVFSSVEWQLNKLRELGVGISDDECGNVLKQAEDFEQLTNTDEPLVTGGFNYDNPKWLLNNLYKTLMKSHGYYVQPDQIRDDEVWYVPGMKPSSGIRLVHFDPYGYPGQTYRQILKSAKMDNVRLAGVEILEYMILRPGNGLTWDGRASRFWSMAGLQAGFNGLSVPIFGTSIDYDGEPHLFLSSVGPNPVRDSWPGSVSVIREC